MMRQAMFMLEAFGFRTSFGFGYFVLLSDLGVSDFVL